MGLISEIFKNSAVDNHYLVSLDLGTEIAKASVFCVDPKEKKVVIVGIGEEFHKFGNIHGSAILNKNGVILTCKKAIDKAKEMAGINSESKKRMRVIIGVSGELAEVAVEVFDYERKNQKVKISQSELEEVTKKAERKIFESVERKMARKDNNGKGSVKFISVDIAEIEIDGYKVANVLDFKGKEIKATAHGTYMLADNFEMIKDISESLNLKLINLAYNPCAVVKSIAGKNEIESGAIFIDVGGSITDVILERNGSVEAVKTFVLGGRMFTEKMPSGNDSKIDKNRPKEKNCFKRDLWFSGIELSLKEFSRNKLLPAKFFVYGGGGQLPEIADSLDRLLLAKDLPFAGKLEIKFIYPKDITAIVDQTGKLTSSRDVVLASIAVSALN